MRVFLTALLIGLFAATIVVDRYSCPDGCSDEVTADSNSNLPGVPCGICHGLSDGPPVIALAPDSVVVPYSDTPTPRRIDPILPTIELPPKHA